MTEEKAKAVVVAGVLGEGNQGWWVLDTCQYRTILQARPPRIDCPEYGPRVVQLPWAEASSRFTALFEALAVESPPSLHAPLPRSSGRLAADPDSLSMNRPSAPTHSVVTASHPIQCDRLLRNQKMKF